MDENRIECEAEIAYYQQKIDNFDRYITEMADPEKRLDAASNAHYRDTENSMIRKLKYENAHTKISAARAEFFLIKDKEGKKAANNIDYVEWLMEFEQTGGSVDGLEAI